MDVWTDDAFVEEIDKFIMQLKEQMKKIDEDQKQRELLDFNAQSLWIIAVVFVVGSVVFAINYQTQ